MLKTISLPVLLSFCLTAGAQTPSLSWVKSVHGVSQNADLESDISDMDADPAGNTYITGEFKGQLNFGSGITLTGNGTDPTLFLAKYASDGTVLWAKKAAPQNPDTDAVFHNSSKIAVDAAGNIYWCGDYLADAVDFGNGVVITRTCTNDCPEGFLLKLNTDGNVLFQKAIRAATGQHVRLAGIAADASGNHYLTGTYFGTEIWLQGGANIGGLTTEGYFLGAYTAAGNAEWVTFQTDASEIPFVDAITVSPDGERIAITGFYSGGGLNFGNGAATSSTAPESRFAAWYNTIGQPLGAGTLASDQQLNIFDIRLDDQYRLWVAGNHNGQIQWNSEILAEAPALTSAAFVTIIAPNTSGTIALSIPHTIVAVPTTTLVLGPDNTFFTAGLSGEALSVPGIGNLGNNGCLDLIVTSGIGPAIQSAQNFGGAGCEKTDNFFFGSKIAIDGEGNLRLCGSFENTGTFGSTFFSGNGLWVAKMNTNLVAVQDPEQLRIGISPQPAAETVQIIFPENARGRCRIVSLTGKTMSESDVQPLVYFRVSGWPAGVYVVECQDEQGRKVVSKLVVQH